MSGDFKDFGCPAMLAAKGNLAVHVKGEDVFVVRPVFVAGGHWFSICADVRAGQVLRQWKPLETVLVGCGYDSTQVKARC